MQLHKHAAPITLGQRVEQMYRQADRQTKRWMMVKHISMYTFYWMQQE